MGVWKTVALMGGQLPGTLVKECDACDELVENLKIW